MSVTLQQQIAESIVGQIEWKDSALGYCVCPGRERHTKPDGPRDCMVRVEKDPSGYQPGVYCFHTSCGPTCDQRSFELRNALGKMAFAENPGRTFEPAAEPSPPRPAFDHARFRRYVADVPEITPQWLCDRSTVLPVNRGPASFLHPLYRPGEKVLVFTEYETQGQCLWEHPGLPYNACALDHFIPGDRGEKAGVWFLCNPVNGAYEINDNGNRSRRSWQTITRWPYMVVESDRAGISRQEWLKAIVRFPLPVVAIYETGGNHPHALIRVDAESKRDFDRIKRQLLPPLVALGADEKTLSGVRLTRLPQCYRRGKHDASGRYHDYDEPRLQRLLYFTPDANDNTLILEKKII